MSAPAIDVYFDYVCPYCLLAEPTISEAANDYDVEVRWHPYELRVYPEPTLRPEDPYLPQVWGASVYPMARRMGIDIKLPSISPQPYSHKAFEGMWYAREHGVDKAYNDAVLRAFFQEDRDIASIAVLEEIAARLDLDTAEFVATLEEDRYGPTQRSAVSRARGDAGVRAVPTVIVGNDRIEGVPQPERLRHLLANMAR